LTSQVNNFQQYKTETLPKPKKKTQSNMEQNNAADEGLLRAQQVTLDCLEYIEKTPLTDLKDTFLMVSQCIEHFEEFPSTELFNEVVHELLTSNVVEFVGNKNGLDYHYKFSENMNHLLPTSSFVSSLPIARNLGDVCVPLNILVVRNVSGFNHRVRSRLFEYQELFGIDASTIWNSVTRPFDELVDSGAKGQKIDPKEWDVALTFTSEKAQIAADFGVTVPTWYTNYKDHHTRMCPNGISFKDILIGIMEVKSAKLDYRREYFVNAHPSMSKDTLWLDVEFYNYYG
jgi:hypothetical protein